MSGKLNVRLGSLANLLYEQPAAKSLGLHTVPDEAILRIRELEAENAIDDTIIAEHELTIDRLQDQIDLIKDASGDEDPLVLIEAAKKLGDDPTAEDVEAIEGELGMGSGAWDMIDPIEIVRQAWRRAREAAEKARQS